MDIRDIIVVDMASSDGSVDMVRSEFPQATLLPDVANRGYGAAVNLGAARAHGEWLLILNSDIELTDPLALSTLIALAEQATSPVIVGAQLVDPDGTPQRSAYRLPGPLALAALFCAPMRYLPGLNAKALGHIPAEELRAPTEVGWVTGAVLLLRRETFSRLGGFDERFFLNSEEVDLCARLQALGGRVMIQPEARAVHHGGASMPTRGKALCWLAEGSALYTRKHFGARRLRAAQAFAVVAFVSSWPVWIARVLLKRWSWRDAARESGSYARALVGALGV